MKEERKIKLPERGMRTKGNKKGGKKKGGGKKRK